MTAGDDRSLGELLRETREAKEMSLRQVARLVGVTPPHLSDVEHGRRGVSDETARKLGEVLGLDPRDVASRSLSSARAARWLEAHPEMKRLIEKSMRRCRCPHCLVLD